jgi:thioglycine synthase
VTELLSRPAPKARGCGDRAVPLETVLRNLPAFRERYGITRIADTTQLDRIGIPTTSAFVPRSADALGVYSGKGRTREEALVSAVMEAVERQVCAAYEPPTASLLPGEIERSLDLRETGYEGPPDRALRCVRARNLLTGEHIFVPLGLANPFVERPQFSHWTTNGLACGSTVVEALYHALFEVVERHRWSEVEIQARLWPHFVRTAYRERFGFAREAPDFPDDAVAAEIELPTGNPDVDDLAGTIRSAGISLRLFALAREPWPVATFARLYEPGCAWPMVHSGMACSWSPGRAAVGAILEAISSRVIEIQGAREDLIRADEHRSGTFRSGRRLAHPPTGRWFFDVPAPSVRLRDLPDRASKDLADDIRRLLGVLRSLDLGCVAMVDLSPADGSAHVVRVIAPALERFKLDGSLTKRAKQRLTMPFAV